MIEFFKQWIVSIFCVSIVTTFIKMMLPESKLKKHINGLVGLVVLLTIISPLISMYNEGSLEDSFSNVLSAFSSNDGSLGSIEGNKNLQQEIVKKEFVESIKKDLRAKLENIGVKVNEIVVQLDKEYNIENIEVGINKTAQEKLNQVNEIVEYINKEYDIDYSKITVLERGE